MSHFKMILMLHEILLMRNLMNFHFDCVQYFYNTYILDHKRRFVKCFIDQMLHFGITVTFKREGTYAILKRNLLHSTGDLKTMIDNLDFLMINQRHDYLIAFKEAKVRYFMNLKIEAFRNITAYVTLYALRKILGKYKRLTNASTILFFCIKTFSSILKFSCDHMIHDRLKKSNDFVDLNSRETHKSNHFHEHLGSIDRFKSKFHVVSS